MLSRLTGQWSSASISARSCWSPPSATSSAKTGRKAQDRCSIGLERLYCVRSPQHDARGGAVRKNPARPKERDLAMATPLLMPKATAVWLVDNTSLSFEQIAGFAGLHPLEVQGIADGDVAGGIMGVNPVQNGQLTREEIGKAESDPAY